MGGKMTPRIQTPGRNRGFRLGLKGGEDKIVGDLGVRGVMAQTAIEGLEGGVEA
jgi:hypothetical protein